MTETIEDPILALDDAHEHLSAESEETPPISKEYTFHVDIKSGGTLYSGAFTNRILTVGEKVVVNSAAIRYNQGLPLESLTFDHRELVQAISHMTESFRTKRGSGERKFRGPKWAKNLFDVEDEEVIRVLWNEVQAHEARYFRRDE